jgi:hypothetical protein
MREERLAAAWPDPPAKLETLFLVKGFNAICSGFNSNRSGKNSLYRGKPLQTVCIGHFGLEFEFERYRAVNRLYRSVNRYRQ